MRTKKINPWPWQDALGFSQAIEVTDAQRLLVCAGQTSVDADGQPLHPGDMAAQIRRALANLETVLRAAGFKPSDIVRLNYYTTDVDAFMAAAEGATASLRAAGGQPASTLLGVTRLASPALLVEIEATAVK